jgi:hypothetical protein
MPIYIWLKNHYLPCTISDYTHICSLMFQISDFYFSFSKHCSLYIFDIHCTGIMMVLDLVNGWRKMPYSYIIDPLHTGFMLYRYHNGTLYTVWTDRLPQWHAMCIVIIIGLEKPQQSEMNSSLNPYYHINCHWVQEIDADRIRTQVSAMESSTKGTINVDSQATLKEIIIK